MAPVPIGFPFELDDDQLDRALTDMLDQANWPGFDNFRLLLPELKLELVASGLRERQRREQAASASRALRVTYAILAVSIVALIISVVVAITT